MDTTISQYIARNTRIATPALVMDEDARHLVPLIVTRLLHLEQAADAWTRKQHDAEGATRTAPDAAQRTLYRQQAQQAKAALDLVFERWTEEVCALGAYEHRLGHR